MVRQLSQVRLLYHWASFIRCLVRKVPLSWLDHEAAAFLAKWRTTLMNKTMARPPVNNTFIENFQRQQLVEEQNEYFPLLQPVVLYVSDERCLETHMCNDDKAWAAMADWEGPSIRRCLLTAQFVRTSSEWSNSANLLNRHHRSFSRYCKGLIVDLAERFFFSLAVRPSDWPDW